MMVKMSFPSFINNEESCWGRHMRPPLQPHLPSPALLGVAPCPGARVGETDCNACISSKLHDDQRYGLRQVRADIVLTEPCLCVLFSILQRMMYMMHDALTGGNIRTTDR